MNHLETISIPYFPNTPALSPSLIEEITSVVFEEPQKITPCDAIFIFGGSHPGLWVQGANAYHLGFGQEIIVTGGHKPTAIHHHTWIHGAKPEAHVIRDELIVRGVPAQKIFAEPRSTNTLENVRFAKEIYEFSNIDKVLTICKCYGVGRQCRTLRHHLPSHVQVIPYPFDTNVGHEGPVVTRDNWMNMEQSRSYIFGQLLKILKYGQRGHLAPLETISDQLKDVVYLWIRTNIEVT